MVENRKKKKNNNNTNYSMKSPTFLRLSYQGNMENTLCHHWGMQGCALFPLSIKD